jgi:predicted lipoprotein with Yx(FWY)xxD motif
MVGRMVLTGMVAAALAALLAVPALAGSRPTLQVHHTAKGTILVDGHGYTVYTYSLDARRKNNCVRFAGCLSVWPPLLARHPVGGKGVRRSLIGTIHLSGYGWQVTYAGHPLYGYVADHRSAEVDHLDVFQSGGYWPGIAPSGRAVK